MIPGGEIDFPFIRIHIVNIETIVQENKDLITKVSETNWMHFCDVQMLRKNMKEAYRPLFLRHHSPKNPLSRWSRSSQKEGGGRFTSPEIHDVENSRSSGENLGETWHNLKASHWKLTMGRLLRWAMGMSPRQNKDNTRSSSTVRYEMIKLCTRSLRVLVVQTLIWLAVALCCRAGQQ